jgi:hypothetical protein
MKKAFLTLVLVFIAYCSFAQSNIFPATGKVGITTTSPNSLLSFGSGAPQGDPTTGTSAGTLIAINDVTVNAFGLGLGAVRNSKYDIWMQTGAANGGGYRWYIGTNEKMTMDYTGNVGIGTISPTTALQIGNFSNGSSNNQLSIPGAYNFEQVRLGQVGNGNAALEFVNHGGVSNSYGVKLLVDVDSGSPGLQLQYAPSASNYSGLSYTTGLYMDISGNVAIGTLNNAGYKLAVNGNAIATSMTVKLNASWPDYVFKPEYKLPSLTEIKTYIDRNQHLPDMPSEAQVTKEGINLGEMNTLLTKKVEELTLYLIEQNKQIAAQQKQIDQLNEKFSTLTKDQN